MAHDLEFHQSCSDRQRIVSRVPATIRRIDQSRRDFERETQSRRRLLQLINADIEYRLARLPDLMMKAIEQQWQRLSAYHREANNRYQRRFRKPPPRTVTPVAADPGDWRAYHWQLDSGHRPLSNIHNAVAALRESPTLSGIIALDESQNRILLRGPLPLARWETFNFEMRRLKDTDLTGLLEYLQSIGLATLSRDDCVAAVRLVARENAWWPDNE
ncbi:hypothetical protein ACCS44_11070 [Rhizobium ruizarguesonis]